MACTPLKIGDGFGFVCSRGRAPIKKCAFCERPSTLLCDHPILDKTCDKPLCRAHAVRVGKDRDYCHDHIHTSEAEGIDG